MLNGNKWFTCLCLCFSIICLFAGDTHVVQSHSSTHCIRTTQIMENFCGTHFVLYFCCIDCLSSSSFVSHSVLVVASSARLASIAICVLSSVVLRSLTFFGSHKVVSVLFCFSFVSHAARLASMAMRVFSAVLKRRFAFCPGSSLYSSSSVYSYSDALLLAVLLAIGVMPEVSVAPVLVSQAEHVVVTFITSIHDFPL